MKYLITGGKTISGEITPSGSKNAALPIIASSLLLNDLITLKNIPNIGDIQTMLEIVESLGSKTSFNNNSLKIFPSINKNETTKKLSCQLRASLYLLAPLLKANNKIILHQPGGCTIGERPIDFHLSLLKSFGANINKKQENYEITNSGLNATNISLSYPSVGTTINAILLALIADGQTNICDYAQEPEVLDTINFLKKAGATISQNNNSLSVFCPKSGLHPITYTIMPDRIEAATFIIAAALLNGNIKIKNSLPKDLEIPLKIFKQIGLNIISNKDSIELKAISNPIKPLNLSTSPYPGFPTDLQPLISVLLAKSSGASSITDSVFPERFKHLLEFEKFGLKIKKDNNQIYIFPSDFHSAEANCLDLRSGAALVLAALASQGKSIINHTELIQRGYEKFHEKLSSLGADIQVFQ
jgi:UDP-N-acetylglucosamine 1-carboxyvinyltransferase